MSSATTPGLAGALIGFAFGLVEYFIAMTMVRRFVGREVDAANKQKEVLPGLPLLEGKMRLLRLVLILAAVTVYPAVGYVVGTTIAS